jgi:hypothetical protein
MESKQDYSIGLNELVNIEVNRLLGELTTAINAFQMSTGMVVKGIEVENKHRKDNKVEVKRLHLDLSNLWRGE